MAAIRKRPPESREQSGQDQQAAFESRQPLNRRRVLRVLAALSAAAGAAAVAKEAKPAQANTGGNFVLGQLNTATTDTELDDPSAWSLIVRNTGNAGGAAVLATAANVNGVYGFTSAAGAAGVLASGAAKGFGVLGTNTGSSGTGVAGSATNGNGVYGTSSANGGIGVYGNATGATSDGVAGVTSAANGRTPNSAPQNAGVMGINTNTTTQAIGTYGVCGTPGFGLHRAATGVVGVANVGFTGGNRHQRINAPSSRGGGLLDHGQR